MPTVTIVRHAPTKNNIEGITTGIDDIPCIDEAIWFNDELKDYSNSNSSSICYVSPLKRAIVTAKKIFPGAALKEDVRLIERNYGIWTSMYKKDIFDLYKEAFDTNGKLDPFFVPPDGESIFEMLDRVLSFINDLDVYDETDTVAVVTHNGVIRLIKLLFFSEDLKKIYYSSTTNVTPEVFDFSRANVQKMRDCASHLLTSYKFK